jgi:tetratricopeptide (TPR) repeat protein
VSGVSLISRAAVAVPLTMAIVLFADGAGSQIPLDEAARAFERGNIAEAEGKLEAVLRQDASNLRALLLIGAVLDSARRYSEAEVYYRRALKLAPESAQVLNNVANHHLASGNSGRARDFYLKAIAIDARHPNANLQLARISVERNEGQAALRYLNRIAESGSSDPGLLELRARALGLTGECSAASEIAGKLESEAVGDWRVHFSAGAIYARCKLYGQAETSFSKAFEGDPRNFDILYNLGLAALNAGHVERAAGVFEAALNMRAGDADCLYMLSRTYLLQHRLVDAAGLLTRAERTAPGRADILLLLAQVSAQLEFYQDAAATYDRYLKLKPADETARRERAFMRASAGQFQSALADLAEHVRKHPRDALGFYELAIAQAFEDRGKAMQSLEQALSLDSGLTQARYTRAVLNIERGNPAASIDDLRLLMDREPRNYHIHVRLGQAYLALGRAPDAANVLRQALELAPDAPSVLFAYGRTLQNLGRQEEAAVILSRLKQSGKTAGSPRPRAGLIDYLSLPAAEQRARYLANLRKNIGTGAGDLRWRIRLGKELLADSNTAEALDVFRGVRSATSDPELLGRCGAILLQFEQYDAAREFLQAAVSGAPSLSAVRLDFATVLFHLEGAGTALRELDNTPEADRKGDYYLLRAQLLDSQGKIPEAAAALNRGMQAAPTRAGLYFQAACFLLKHGMNREALALLDQASRIVSDSRELLLAHWVTLNLAHREVDGRKLLATIQARWPEWDRPYLLNGIFLEMQLESAQARRSLETAIALGTNTPEVYYYHALAITHTNPEDVPAAENAIARALALNSSDPYIYLLAGNIALSKNDYPAAIRHLLEATRLQPALVPAHNALRRAYKAIGDEQKWAAELEVIKRIGQEKAVSDNPFSVEELLFTVRPPL